MVALTQSVWVECAGWQATPEARRSCCEQAANCPNRQGDQDNWRVVTQAAADSCCAASESDESPQSSSPFALSITLAVLQPAAPALAAMPVHARLDTPQGLGLHASSVPTHLLLSVFLV